MSVVLYSVLKVTLIETEVYVEVNMVSKDWETM